MKQNRIAPTAGEESRWEPTKFQYLIRYRPTRVYFAKCKAGGKQYRFSLENTVISVAHAKVGDEMAERKSAVPVKNLGRMLMRDANATYSRDVQANSALKGTTKAYHGEVLLILQKTWPRIEQLEVSEITEAQCQAWARKLGVDFSPTRFNCASPFSVTFSKSASRQEPTTTTPLPV